MDALQTGYSSPSVLWMVSTSEEDPVEGRVPGRSQPSSPELGEVAGQKTNKRENGLQYRGWRIIEILSSSEVSLFMGQYTAFVRCLRPKP